MQEGGSQKKSIECGGVRRGRRNIPGRATCTGEGSEKRERQHVWKPQKSLAGPQQGGDGPEEVKLER